MRRGTKARRGDQIFWENNFTKIKDLSLVYFCFAVSGGIFNIYMCELMQFMHGHCLCSVLQLRTFGFKK